MAIDYDRGVILTKSAGSDIAVCMYADDPGVYFAQNGVPVSREMARLAGHDVEAHAQERLRIKRRKEALDAIDRDFGIVAPGEVIEEIGNLAVVHMGNGWYEVRDGEDVNVAPARLRKDAAVDFAKSMIVGLQEQETAELEKVVAGAAPTEPAKARASK